MLSLAIIISDDNLASISFPGILVALKRAVVISYSTHFFLAIAASILSYRFVTSLTACLASSPGRMRRTDVCISLLVIVERLL